MDKTQFAKDIRSAIKSGKLDTLRDLLEKEPEMLTWMTPFGTWLHVAAAHGHLEIVEYLINAGIDINAQGGTFSTNALERATTKGHLEIVEYLINAGIDINAQGGTFSTNALERATTKGHLEIAEYLISRNVEIDISEPDRNPLFAAIYGGHLEIVKLLVKNNIDISIKYSGDTMKDMGAYEFAIERGQTEIAEYLKQKMDEKK